MHLATSLVTLLAASVAAQSATCKTKPADTTQTDKLAANALIQLAKYERESGHSGPCTLSKAARRKEWLVTTSSLPHPLPINIT